MTRTELIAALENAEGPSRKIDTEIADISGIRLGQLGHALPYTSSIDAALTLVPEGWGVSLKVAPIKDGVKNQHCWVTDWGESDEEMDAINCATPAIALCIASLRAIRNGN